MTFKNNFFTNFIILIISTLILLILSPIGFIFFPKETSDGLKRSFKFFQNINQIALINLKNNQSKNDSKNTPSKSTNDSFTGQALSGHIDIVIVVSLIASIFFLCFLAFSSLTDYHKNLKLSQSIIVNVQRTNIDFIKNRKIMFHDKMPLTPTLTQDENSYTLKYSNLSKPFCSDLLSETILKKQIDRIKNKWIIPYVHTRILVNGSDVTNQDYINARDACSDSTDFEFHLDRKKSKTEINEYLKLVKEKEIFKEIYIQSKIEYKNIKNLFKGFKANNLMLHFDSSFFEKVSNFNDLSYKIDYKFNYNKCIILLNNIFDFKDIKQSEFLNQTYLLNGNYIIKSSAEYEKASFSNPILDAKNAIASIDFTKHCKNNNTMQIIYTRY